jgi:hypothetical protein
MYTCRLIIGMVAAATFTTIANAQDWKAKYPELVFAVLLPKMRPAYRIAMLRSLTTYPRNSARRSPYACQ